MRRACAILITLVAAVCNAAPFDKAADPTTSTSAPAPMAAPAEATTEKLAQVPQENTLQIEEHLTVADKQNEKPTLEHKTKDQPQLDNHLIKPEDNLPPPISQHHHVQEHELHKQPSSPQSTPLPGHHKLQEESEISDELNEEIALLQAIGAVAVSLELAILEELQQANAFKNQEYQHEHQRHDEHNDHEQLITDHRP